MNRGTGVGIARLTRGKFQPPADYYCAALAPIDEELCALVARRKEISGNKPGFPGVDRIAAWCESYGLDEPMILAVFSRLCTGERYQAPLVPTGFRRFVPIVKHVERDGVVYAVTHMKQYNNMSIVHIEISPREPSEESIEMLHTHVELFIGPAYSCCQDSGGGSDKGMQYSFSVTPPLPDEVTDVEFSLKVTPRRPEIPEPTRRIKAAEFIVR